MAQPIWNANTKSYSLQEKTDPKDRIEVEVGDSQDSSVFHPQMKLMRWDNEANVSFRLVHTFIPGNVTQTESNGVITWQKKQGNNIWTAKFYEDFGTPEGAYKFVELTLPAKPPTNQISFTTTSKDVDFFYQPPLTQQEIDEGASRPEDVVGSYAIYSKSSGGMNKADGKEYKTGKVGHLYRAKLIDANGNEKWADYNTDLNETGILTLSVDQTWLDNAVYPVVVDPTFGYTSIGASFAGSAHDLRGNTSAPASGNGDVTKMTAYLEIAAGESAKLGMYLTSSDAFIVGGSELTTEATGWVDSAMSTSVIDGTNYDLVFYTGANVVRCASDSGETDGYLDLYGSGYPTFPDPATPTRVGTSFYSIYATYTAAGGGSSINFFKSLLGVGFSWILLLTKLVFSR